MLTPFLKGAKSVDALRKQGEDERARLRKSVRDDFYLRVTGRGQYDWKTGDPDNLLPNR